jgi:hypothetical protein
MKRAWVGATLLAIAAMLPARGEAAPRINAPGKIDTGRTIALEADVGCGPEVAFAMWSTEAGVRSFFAPAARIGGVGGTYTIVFFPEDDAEGWDFGSAGARVLAAEPGEFFAFEWVTFAGDARHGAAAPPHAPRNLQRPDPLPTWVELTFTSQSGGTHISFRHYGYGEGALWDESRIWFTRAWSGVLERMRDVCTRAQD